MVAHRRVVPAATPAAQPTMLRTCCLILCLVAGSRQLKITDIVVPNAVEAGSNAELQCRFSLDAKEDWPYLKWWWTPMYGAEDDQLPKLLYQHLPGREPQVFNQNIQLAGNDTIIVNNMEYSDSGRYECEVSGNTEDRVHRQLIVFSNGSGPILNISSTADGPDDDSEEDVALECEAYDVTPQLELVISVNGNEVDTTKDISNTTEGLFNARVNATVSKADVLGAEVRCELYFVNKNISHPPYIDSQTYRSGAGLSTTEAVEDTTQLGATSDPLQNQTDASLHIYSSWMLVAAVVPIHLYNIV